MVADDERPFARWADLTGVSKERRPGKSVYIYALIDPRDETVRYVGKTEQSPAVRLAQHMYRPTNHRMRGWLGDLRGRGWAPEVRVLAYCEKRHWDRLEIFWVQKVAKLGRLLNMDPGGQTRGPGGRLSERGQRLTRRLDKKIAKAAKLGALGGPVASSEAPPVAVKQIADSERADRASNASSHRKPAIPSREGTPGVAGAGGPSVEEGALGRTRST